MNPPLENTSPARHLVSLGEGIYTVSEVCRILQPSMTSRRVHYWLNTGLIGDPIRWGRRGHPTLLSFQQLLRIRTVQHLKDELRVSLPRVREAFHFVLTKLFAEDWNELQFAVVHRKIVVRSGDERMSIPLGQGVLPGVIHDLERYVDETQRAWHERRLAIPGRSHLESNARVQSGSPVITGTRLETATLALFVGPDALVDSSILRQLRDTYSRVPRQAIVEALEFEGVEVAA